MLSVIGLLVVIIVIAIIVIDFLQGFFGAKGGTWSRLLAAGKGSATILLHRVLMLFGLFTTALVQLADWLNAPGVADGIKAYLSPQLCALFVIGIALLTEWARRRSLKQPAAAAAPAAG